MPGWWSASTSADSLFKRTAVDLGFLDPDKNKPHVQIARLYGAPEIIAKQAARKALPKQEYRWLLEELRVSFFAQELRTPQPLSIKRLDKLWLQINS